MFEIFSMSGSDFVKKRSRIILSVVLCVVLMFSSVTGAAAADVAASSQSTKTTIMEGIADTLNTAFNATVENLLNLLVKLIPSSYKVGSLSTYKSENFYRGNSKFLDAPAANAQWSLGYSSASVVPDDFSKGLYCKGGYDVDVKLTEMLDDLKVRVIALNDGSGRGTSVFAVVDCLGLANEDVRSIRAALADYAKANNIISINVSATHTHSGIDTQGIYTNTFSKVFKNLGLSLIRSKNLEAAVNEDFLNNIIAKTVQCVKNAYESMTPGTLTYAHSDISDYIRDRTAPDIHIDELYRLMFIPDDGSTGTIIANMGVHPETIGFGMKIGSSDFVYYTEQVINKAGYNFMFIQGAVGTITESMGMSNDGITADRIESTVRYGEEIAYLLLGMTMSEAECKSRVVDYEREAKAVGSESYTPWYEGHVAADEKEVAPILNIKHKEYNAPVDNGVYEALGKVSLANNKMLKDEKGNFYTATEVGYMELGTDIKIILCPGETYAELIKGGENMEGFAYKTAYEIMGTEDVLVFDLMNDAVGYIMPDDYFTYATIRYTEDDGLKIDSSWGLTSLGRHAATNIYGEIYSLYDSVK